MGAPKANLNAARNGGRLTRLTLGELPKTMRRLTTQARTYRRGLEDVVMEVKEEVNVIDAHLVDEAATAEVHAAVCRWLLRERLEKMTATDILACSREILRAKTTRNRAVERLGLEREQKNVWDALYGPDEPPEHPDTPPDVASPTSEQGTRQVNPETQQPVRGDERHGNDRSQNH